MLKHIVCFKLKEGASPEKTKEILLSMRWKVPMVRNIEVGIDELRSDRSFDVILTVLLDDMAALDDYQIDSYHVNVAKVYMNKVVEKSIAIDYTI